MTFDMYQPDDEPSDIHERVLHTDEYAALGLPDPIGPSQPLVLNQRYFMLRMQFGAWVWVEDTSYQIEIGALD